MTRGQRGPSVVLIHGATSSPRAWEDVAPIVGREYEVLTPSLAGHRGGVPLPSGRSGVIDRIADAMCDHLTDAGVEAAHIVGNSLGGWVALELARRGRAKSVLAISPAGAWRSSRDLHRLLSVFRSTPLMLRANGAIDIARRRHLRGIMLRLMAERADRMTSAQVTAMFEDIVACRALPDILKGARTNGPLQPILDRTYPVRIAWGTKDRLLPFMHYGVPMFNAVPAAEFTPLPGLGHVPMIDDPLAVADAILDFVRGVDGARTGRW